MDSYVITQNGIPVKVVRAENDQIAEAAKLRFVAEMSAAHNIKFSIFDLRMVGTLETGGEDGC